MPDAPASMVVATSNDHKLKEFAEILSGIELVPLPADIDSPPEDGLTFEANALIKARAARDATGAAVIADDSGIEAEALDGRPGVYSARFAGEGASDGENLAKLLREVGEAGQNRQVAYVCVVAFIDEDGNETVFEGRCWGVLIESPRGDGGFGYDPAFVPDATGPADPRTMAELDPEEKHAISHRGVAARALARYLGGGADGPGDVGGRDDPPMEKVRS